LKRDEEQEREYRSKEGKSAIDKRRTAELQPVNQPLFLRVRLPVSELVRLVESDPNAVYPIIDVFIQEVKQLQPQVIKEMVSAYIDPSKIRTDRKTGLPVTNKERVLEGIITLLNVKDKKSIFEEASEGEKIVLIFEALKRYLDYHLEEIKSLVFFLKEVFVEREELSNQIAGKESVLNEVTNIELELESIKASLESLVENLKTKNQDINLEFQEILTNLSVPFANMLRIVNHLPKDPNIVSSETKVA
jgi:hypothetical protein